MLLFWLEANKSEQGMLISILQKSAILAVVAVSMNLLNGFTGLFSLGQAGFMAIGAYITAILTIPVDSLDGVYYMNGVTPGCGAQRGDGVRPLVAPVGYPFLALIVGGLVAAGVRGAHRHPGAAPEERLSGHCDPGLFRDHPRDLFEPPDGHDYQRLLRAQ